MISFKCFIYLFWLICYIPNSFGANLTEYNPMEIERSTCIKLTAAGWISVNVNYQICVCFWHQGSLEEKANHRFDKLVDRSYPSVTDFNGTKRVREIVRWRVQKNPLTDDWQLPTDIIGRRAFMIYVTWRSQLVSCCKI